MSTYIIDGVRTPIGSFGGSLSSVRADDLAALVIKTLISKNPNVDSSAIDDVLLGCVNQAGEDNRNVARMALLLAELPVTVPGETINRLCASGMSAVINGHRAIANSDANLIIAGGVEHMTRSPYVISKASKPYGTDAQMVDSSFGWRFINPKMEEMYGTEAMGKTAENLVELYHISREEQDNFAYNSQMKATKARDNGRLDKEIIQVPIPSKENPEAVFTTDEFIKSSTTIEKLSTLKPAFKKDGSVTAGNSSGLNDGATAILLASDNAVEKYNLHPRAKILASAVVGVEPRIMGIGPVEASNKALTKAGLTLDDIDVIEINEAFAAQSLACLKLLNIDINDTRVNPNGGAIALGHPLGMSGARIINSAALELQLQNKKYALVTMCIGVGQGYAVVIERV
jgi:3-oxoadipyl-CoA thiolase